MRKSIGIFIAFSLFIISFAQESDFEPKIELVPSFLASYSFEEEETIFAAEIYTAYWFQEKWGAGISNTAKFKEDIMLWDMAFLGSYKAAEWLCINSGINVGFPHDGVRDGLEPGFYFETEFNWQVKENFHFGLVLGTVVSENTEITGGLHLGFELPANSPK